MLLLQEKMWKLVDKNKSWGDTEEAFQVNYALLVMLLVIY